MGHVDDADVRRLQWCYGFFIIFISLCVRSRSIRERLCYYMMVFCRFLFRSLSHCAFVGRRAGFRIRSCRRNWLEARASRRTGGQARGQRVERAGNPRAPGGPESAATKAARRPPPALLSFFPQQHTHLIRRPTLPMRRVLLDRATLSSSCFIRTTRRIMYASPYTALPARSPALTAGGSGCRRAARWAGLGWAGLHAGLATVDHRYAHNLPTLLVKVQPRPACLKFKTELLPCWVSYHGNLLIVRGAVKLVDTSFTNSLPHC